MGARTSDFVSIVWQVRSRFVHRSWKWNCETEPISNGSMRASMHVSKPLQAAQIGGSRENEVANTVSISQHRTDCIIKHLVI